MSVISINVKLNNTLEVLIPGKEGKTKKLLKDIAIIMGQRKIFFSTGCQLYYLNYKGKE